MKEVSPAERFPQVYTSEDKDRQPLEDDAWPYGPGVAAKQETKNLTATVCPTGKLCFGELLGPFKERIYLYQAQPLVFLFTIK